MNPIRKIQLVVAYSILIATQISAQQQLVGPVINPSNGHTYYLLNSSDWTTARDQAAYFGGQLVTVHDSSEQSWIYQTFANPAGGPQRRLWLGLSDYRTEGVFQWESGEVLSFSFWASGQPDNSSGIEDYVHMNAPYDLQPGTWNDLPNINLETFGVIEVDARILLGPIVNPSNGHRYFLLDSSTWSDGRVTAQALGGSLVTINDQNEQAWVYQTFANPSASQGRRLWIGLSDWQNEGVFQWENGEPFSYSFWANGQPDNDSGLEDYVHMNAPYDLQPGTWNDLPDVNLQTFAVVEVIPEPASKWTVLLGACVLAGLLRRRSSATT